MVKYDETSDYIVNLFNEVRDNTTIPHWVEFRVLTNNKLKKMCDIIKANDLVQLLTEGLNFVVVVNEKIMEQLPNEMQKIAFDELLAGVHISDSDAVSIEKPDFNTYTGVLSKYGDAEIIKLHESIISLYDVAKQKEAEEKAEIKAKKSKKVKD